MMSETSTFETDLPEVVMPPAGSKAGDIPNMTWSRHVWLVVPSTESAAQRALRTKIAAELKRRDLAYGVIRATRPRAKGEAPVEVLTAPDVRRLYMSLHTHLVMVIVTGGVRVQGDVSEQATRRGSIPLAEFVAYKSSFHLITKELELGRALEEFDAWASASHGVDPRRDPRLLPMQCFRRREQVDLSIASQRDLFVTLHGSPLVDATQATWDVAKELHTRDCLHVAGTTLQIGFHWDVQTRVKTYFLNGWERWQSSSRRYVNIHPNGVIRGRYATKTHPRAGDTATGELPRRTPAHRRKSRTGR